MINKTKKLKRYGKACFIVGVAFGMIVGVVFSILVGVCF